MTTPSRQAETSAHERVYRAMRGKVMHGEVLPGQAITLRGLAQEFGVSMTPAREAMRRLAAEGALSISATGRFFTPEPNNDRIEELAALRALLEPEVAARALPRAHFALIDRMQLINSRVSQAVAQNDPVAYVQANLEFHRSLYLRAQAPAMLAMIETVWLQLGPMMRKLYGQRTNKETPRLHLTILAALKAGDEAALRLAVRTDVSQGLKMLMA